jgi:hypothetical protein
MYGVGQNKNIYCDLLDSVKLLNDAAPKIEVNIFILLNAIQYIHKIKVLALAHSCCFFLPLIFLYGLGITDIKV